MTKVTKPDNWSSNYVLKYDAWNRLVTVKDGTTTVATYFYDGLNRRIKKVVGSETRLFYYNRNWQCLEEYVGSSLKSRYTWGLRYVDDLVLHHVPGVSDLYAIADPNWNVVALVNPSGVVQERYTYSAFGKLNIFDANFTTRSTSSYNITRTFTGQVLDTETGLMLYRNRVYHLTLGRFVQRDPIGYVANDENLYRYVTNSVFSRRDQLGLASKPQNWGKDNPWDPMMSSSCEDNCDTAFQNCKEKSGTWTRRGATKICQPMYDSCLKYCTDVQACSGEIPRKGPGGGLALTAASTTVAGVSAGAKTLPKAVRVGGVVLGGIGTAVGLADAAGSIRGGVGVGIKALTGNFYEKKRACTGSNSSTDSECANSTSNGDQCNGSWISNDPDPPMTIARVDWFNVCGSSTIYFINTDTKGKQRSYETSNGNCSGSNPCVSPDQILAILSSL